MSFFDDWAEVTTLMPGEAPDIYDEVDWAADMVKAVNCVAKAVEGLTATSPDDFLEFMASAPSREDKALAAAMLNMSGCALCALGVWRCLGMGSPTLWEKYRIGKAVADVVSVARRQDAWVDDFEKDSQPLEPGDVVLIASPEHVFTVLDSPQEQNGWYVFNALHGGRKTVEGKQTLEITETKAAWQGKRLMVTGKTKTGIQAKQRAVMGLARVTKMTPSRPAKLPPTWEA